MATTVTADESSVKVSVVEESVNVNVCEKVVEVSTSITGPQGIRGTQVLSGPVDPSPIIGLIGDQYLNTTSGYIFGPKTESGWGTGVLIGSGLKIEDVSFIHYQIVAENQWIITHDLEFNPNITVVDLSGNVIEGDYQYSGNTITATFSQAITGAAYLS